ncbi:MAG TPA: hypothetical protein VME45_16090 [Stellaceae bacterium]|nr:hypothetical protein [Stellaceae bacterium]
MISRPQADPLRVREKDGTAQHASLALLLGAVKKCADARGISYLRFLREAVETALTAAKNENNPERIKAR